MTLHIAVADTQHADAVATLDLDQNSGWCGGRGEGGGSRHLAGIAKKSPGLTLYHQVVDLAESAIERDSTSRALLRAV